MRNNIRSVPAVALIGGLFLMALSTMAPAALDERHAAIDRLGELNGIALQCRYIDQVRRMKAAVVQHAPKQRSYGLAFDQATNRAFLAFIEQQGACPTEEALARDVGHRIDAIRAAFSNP